MDFKCLMQLNMDLVSDLRHLDNKIFDLKVLNDLSEMDKKRLFEIANINSNLVEKTIKLNGLAINFLRKKFDREELKK